MTSNKEGRPSLGSVPEVVRVRDWLQLCVLFLGFVLCYKGRRTEGWGTYPPRPYTSGRVHFSVPHGKTVSLLVTRNFGFRWRSDQTPDLNVSFRSEGVRLRTYVWPFFINETRMDLSDTELSTSLGQPSLSDRLGGGSPGWVLGKTSFLFLLYHFSSRRSLTRVF